MRAWCSICRSRQEVMDEFFTDTGDEREQVVTYYAMPLACGHDANDGGGTPPSRRPIYDRILVDRLVELQKGANHD